MELRPFQPSPIGPQAAADNYTGFSKKAQLAFYTRLYHLGLLAGSITGVTIASNMPLLWQKAYRKIQQTPNYKAREDPVWQLSHNVPAPWFQVLHDMDDEVPPRPPAQHDLEYAKRQGVIFVRPEAPCWVPRPYITVAPQLHPVYAISGPYHNVGGSFHQQHSTAASPNYPGSVAHRQQFIPVSVQPQYSTSAPQPWQDLMSLVQPIRRTTPPSCYQDLYQTMPGPDEKPQSEDDDMVAITDVVKQAAASQVSAVQIHHQRAESVADAEGPRNFASPSATSKAVANTPIARATKRMATDEVPETSRRYAKILKLDNVMPMVLDQSADIGQADTDEGILEDTFENPRSQDEQCFEDPSDSLPGPMAQIVYGEFSLEESGNYVQSFPSMENGLQPFSPMENNLHPDGFSLSGPVIWDHAAVIEEIFWNEK